MEKRMKIKELGHVAFKCRNIKKSEEFYCEILGFTRKFTMTYSDLAEAAKQRAIDHNYEPPKEMIEALSQKADKTWFVYLQICSNQFVELFEAGDATEMSIPDDKHFNYQHMALIVDGIENVRDELIEKGVEIDIELDRSVDSNSGFWIHDPDGNKIEIIQYSENAPQLK